MTTPAQKPPGAGGGPVAIRGFLVQTLVALLDLVQAESSFTEITLEPPVGDEQFDFLWKDKDGSHATQVKSTVNSFTRADVEKWADKLQKARRDEQCRLMLIGNIPPSLDGLNSVGAVVIETKNLHLDDLVEQAAQRLAKFLEREKQNAGTGEDREMVVHALVSKLQHRSTTSERFTREAFIKLLTRWVKEAPRQDRPIDISRIIKYAPAELIGREDETKLLSDAWAKVCKAETPRPHVLTFVALGGEGKTSLVAKWAAELAHQDWPGCDAVFAWSFYSQGTPDQAVASSDTFLKEALTFFGDPAMAGSAAGAAHPRWPGAAAIRAHLPHAGRAQGPEPRRPAQRARRHQPRPVRRHHPLFHPRPVRLLADHRAGGQAHAPFQSCRRGAAPVVRREGHAKGIREAGGGCERPRAHPEPPRQLPARRPRRGHPPA